MRYASAFRSIGLTLLLACMLVFLLWMNGTLPSMGDDLATLRVSVADDGSEANGHSKAPSISSDGRFVAFTSYANNLVANDTTGPDTFVYNRETRALTRVSDVTYTQISGNGRFLAFSSSKDNIVPGDTNGLSDVFRLVWETGQMKRISQAYDGTETNGDSWAATISTDGCQVAFTSEATNLIATQSGTSAHRNSVAPGYIAWQVYVYNCTDDTIRLASVSTGGNRANRDSWLGSISADGRYVSFSSEADNLAPLGVLYQDQENVYRHDLQTGETIYVSKNINGQLSDQSARNGAISANGRFVAFTSGSFDMVPGDTNGLRDVFIRDVDTGTTRRASLASNGDQATGWSNTLALSDDGQKVAFVSAANNLVQSDTNGKEDVFVHDVAPGVTTRVSIGSDGRQANDDIENGDLSGDGRFVTFSTDASNLVIGDTNGDEDVFLHDRLGSPQPWTTLTPTTTQTPTATPTQAGPGELDLQATSEDIIPDGKEEVTIAATLEDTEGKPLAGRTITFELAPALGSLDATQCTTDDHGWCLVTYTAPSPDQVYNNTYGFGAETVQIKASGAGLYDEITLFFEYLKITETQPRHAARNIDWTIEDISASFGQPVKPDTIPGNFIVRSSEFYPPGTVCLGQSDSQMARCSLIITGTANAGKGLVITARLKSGPEGVRAENGAMLQRDFYWMFYTTPELQPSLVPVQVSEGAYLPPRPPYWVPSKPGVVRVDAGLAEDTELDWVEARVELSYNGGAPFTSTQKFYPGLSSAPPPIRSKGNSAVFYSRFNQVPFTGTGEQNIFAKVIPVGQERDPQRSYDAEAKADVRRLAERFRPIRVRMYPIALHMSPSWGIDYPWSAGQTLNHLRGSKLYTSGIEVIKRLLPLSSISPMFSRTAVASTPSGVSPSELGYLASVARRNDWRTLGEQRTGGIAILVVPAQWMNTVNKDNPIFLDSGFSRVCIVAEDASPAAIAQCIGRVWGLKPGQWGTADSPRDPIFIGYDVSGDRYVNGDERSLLGPDYALALMSPELKRAESKQVWIDRDNYWSLARKMTEGLLPMAGEQTADDQVMMVVGGEITGRTTVESGRLDIVEMPGRQTALPTPGENGAYSLRVKDAGDNLLADFPFASEFTSFSDTSEYASFLFNIPVPSTAAQVELLHNGNTLSVVAASDNKPAVDILQPVAGQYQDLIQVNWSASDGDAQDELSYTLYYSRDDGTTWTLIYQDTTAPPWVLDTSQYGNCHFCRVKVIAYDGFHSAQAQSQTFSVKNEPAVAMVVPAGETTDAPLLTEITAYFRDPMEGASITASSFTLTDAFDRPVAGTVFYDEYTFQASFQPSTELDPAMIYTARLAPTIRDSFNQELGEPFVWMFRTEIGVPALYLPMCWRASSTLSTPTPSATPTLPLPNTPTPTRTPSPTLTPTPVDEWQVIYQDGFEANIIAPWQLFGEPTWDQTSCRAFTGDYSIWPASSGSGAGEPCSGTYPPDVNAWLVYGPFDLSDAITSEITFNRWQRTEPEYDSFSWAVSLDDDMYYGWRSTGATDGWNTVTFDLGDVSELGDLNGQQQAWFALIFQSDDSISDEGVYVDDLLIRKRMTAVTSSTQEKPSAELPHLQPMTAVRP